MKRFGLNSGYIGIDRRQDEAGIAPLQKAYLERIRDAGNYLPLPELLLDLYPNAAVAYSLRKISAAYTGNAIRVRRSSDNAEQDIGFATENLDTASLTSFCSGTDGFVTVWYDQSGNGRNAQQVAAADQPQIVGGGSILSLNSKPAIYTDGISDFLITSNTFQYNNATVVFIAAQVPGEASYGRFIDNVFTSGFWFGRDISNTALNGGFVQPTSPFGAVIAYPNNTQFLMFSTRNGNLTTNIVNSTTSNSRSTTAGLTPPNPIRIGKAAAGAEHGRKYHQEYILYYTDQSSNRIGIESNINTYYNIY